MSGALGLARSSLAFLLIVGFTAKAAYAQPVPPAGPGGSAPSSAASADAPSVEDRATAAKKYEEASALARQGRWQAAYPLFNEAWGRLKHWQIALSLGRVEIEIGKFHAAETHLSFALAAPELPAGDRPEVTRLIALAREKQGVIRLVATAQGPARVWLDDRRIGVTPFSGSVTADPGEHRVELRFGSARKALLVNVTTGQTRDVEIDLRVPEMDIPVPAETLSSHGPTGPTLPGGLEADASPSSFPAKAVLLGTFGGLAVTASALGAGLLVVAGDRENELARKGRYAENQSLEDDRAAFLNGAVWSFLAAGVFAGGALTTLLAWPGDRSKEKTALRLEWTGSGARATLRW